MVKQVVAILALVALVFSTVALAEGGKNRKRWGNRYGAISACPQDGAVAMRVQQRDRDGDCDGDCDGDGPFGPNGPNGPNGPDGDGPDGDGPNGYGPGDGTGNDGEGPEDGSGYGPGGE